MNQAIITAAGILAFIITGVMIETGGCQHAMTTSTIFFLFFTVILPFLLWRFSMIGTHGRTREGLPLAIPEPPVSWINLSSSVEAVMGQGEPDLDNVTQMSLRRLRHEIDRQKSQFVGLNINCGPPGRSSWRFFSDAGPYKRGDYPVFAEPGRSKTHVWAIRLSNVHGTHILIYGMRIQHISFEKTFAGSVTISNCQIGSIHMDTNDNQIN